MRHSFRRSTHNASTKRPGSCRFGAVLRDAFAQTVLGACPEFRPLAESVLRTTLHTHVADPAALAKEVLDAFPALPLHDDVVEGMRKLTTAGCTLATFTNGTAAVTDQLLQGTSATPANRLEISVIAIMMYLSALPVAECLFACV
jgi:hypothetical protein